MRAPGIMSAIAHGVYVGLTGDLSRTTETRLALMEALQSMSAMPSDAE